MRAAWLLALLFIAPVAVRASPDEIDVLVGGLDYDPEVGLWETGVWPVVGLSPNALPQSVVAAFVQTQAGTVLYDQQYDHYKVLEVKKTPLSKVAGSPYTGVLIASNSGGRTILLLRYQGEGWLVRPFSLPSRSR